MMYMNLQKGSVTDYKDWVYPVRERKDTYSMTGVAGDEEIIEVCAEKMKEKCSPNCFLIIGVAGLSKDTPSSYRLRGFYGTNKLEVNNPLRKTTYQEEEGGSIYDYFWFSITDQVNYDSASFDYQVSLGTEPGHNPDLYISLMDGR
jgi:hypothetical protein